MMAYTTRQNGLRAAMGIAGATLLIGIGCTMPTPPDIEDVTDPIAAERSFEAQQHGTVKLRAVDENVVTSDRHVAGTLLRKVDESAPSETFQRRADDSARHEIKAIIFIDGVRIDTDATSASGGGNVTFDLQNELRPDQIERIEVIKGPAAARLYSPAAQAGVVLITTKAKAARGGSNR